MSQINQIQISFIPVQDRLLMRMNTKDSSEFQFLLTRRYVKLLWPALINMLESDEQVIIQETQEAKKEVLSFQHQKAAQKMDYTKKYETQMDSKPLGNEPVLLAKVSVKTTETGPQVLCMHPEHGQGIELALDKTLLHSICKLLKDTVAKAEWDMDLSRSLSAPQTPEASQSSTIN